MARSVTIKHLNNRFMTYLGLCITDWADIEEQLFGICAEILQTTPAKAAVVYFRTPSLSGRIDLVDELLAVAISAEKDDKQAKAHAKEWNSLYKAIRSELSIRNQLAHSPIRPVFVGSVIDWHSYFNRKVQFESSAGAFELMRPKGNKKKPLTVDDMKIYLGRLSALFVRLRSFREGVLPLYLPAERP